MKTLKYICEALVKGNANKTDNELHNIPDKLKNIDFIQWWQAKPYIDEFKKYAMSMHFDKVRYVFKSGSNEFTIFLYNKKIQPSRYCVGYDGTFSEKYKNSTLSFKNCLIEAYKYIHKHK